MVQSEKSGSLQKSAACFSDTWWKTARRVDFNRMSRWLLQISVRVQQPFQIVIVQRNSSSLSQMVMMTPRGVADATSKPQCTSKRPLLRSVIGAVIIIGSRSVRCYCELSLLLLHIGPSFLSCVMFMLQLMIWVWKRISGIRTPWETSDRSKMNFCFM